MTRALAGLLVSSLSPLPSRCALFSKTKNSRVGVGDGARSATVPAAPGEAREARGLVNSSINARACGNL